MNKLALLALNKKLGGGGSTELSPFDDFIEGNTTEISSGVSKIASKAFYGWETPTSANFPNATEIGNSAFRKCIALTSANFQNATKIETYAFDGCKKLTSVKFPSATQFGPHAFSSCSALTSVDFPNATSIDTGLFYGCSALTSANFPNATSIGGYVFSSCKELITVNFPNATNIGSDAFCDCWALKAVILRSETRCRLHNTDVFRRCYHILGTVDSQYNPNGDKDGYFYVPRALLSDDDATKDYRRATNWATFATQFRALEDYTVDGTTTGELDPNKI